MRRVFYACVFGVLATACAVFAEPESVLDDESIELTEPRPKRRPLVVLKQSSIRGRVFVLTDDDKERAAVKLKIEIKDMEGEILLYSTKTDKQGQFTLPNLDVGKYELTTGRLKLELRVEDPIDAPTSMRRIPKAILIFIPSALVE